MTCSPYLTLIQINISQGVFVLAVTHNGNWIVGSNDNWGVDKGGLSYSLSLVSRMASVFYGIELETIALMMEEQEAVMRCRCDCFDVVRCRALICEAVMR